jgi:hypothetical protein
MIERLIKETISYDSYVSSSKNALNGSSVRIPIMAIMRKIFNLLNISKKR